LQLPSTVSVTVIINAFFPEKVEFSVNETLADEKTGVLAR
jgi:hypothetical protein